MLSAILYAATLAAPETMPAQFHQAPALVHQIKKRNRRGGSSSDQRKRRSNAPYYVGLLLIIGDKEYSCDNGTRPVLLNNGQVVCFGN